MIHNHASFDAKYDSDIDVLYISVGREFADHIIEDIRGIVWRYDASNSLIGATIVDFSSWWSHKREQLSRHFARRFSILQTEIMISVEKALHKPYN
jgi:predicted nucleotidyltransferase